MEMETAGAILGHLLGIAFILLCVIGVLMLFLQSLTAVILWLTWLINIAAWLSGFFSGLFSFIPRPDARASRRKATSAVRQPAESARRQGPCLPASQG
jgi:hypothetical protein